MQLSTERPQRPVRIDGRRLRSARTKQSIVEAYLALLRGAPEIPTATAIARQAGCSVRSIFERFPDLHGLRVAAADYAFTQGTAQAVARDQDGDRMTRIRSHVETRSWICDQWLPLWRALNANQGDSPELRARVQLVRLAIVRRIEQMYEAELSTLDEVKRQQTVLAIDSLIDFENWARMRDFSALSVEEAREVWIKAIDRLLPPTPARPRGRRAVS